MATKINWGIKRLETLEVTGGCTKCSPGCTNCWAIKEVWRMAGKKALAKKWGDLVEKKEGKLNWTGKIKLFPEALESPKLKGSGKTFFVDSKADLFHEKVPFKFQVKVFDMISKCHQHKFMILTKREDIMCAFFNCYYDDPAYDNAPKNYQHVHLGVTICTQEEADRILPIALQVPGFNFISFEPLLGPIDMHQSQSQKDVLWRRTHGGSYERKFIKKVIIGCESGPKRRPIARKHIKDLYDQCEAAGVKVMIKQMAENEDGTGKVCKDPAKCNDRLGV